MRPGDTPTDAWSPVAALGAADRAGAELRASLSLDPGEVGLDGQDAGRLLRWLSDVDEAVRSLYVAGLSYPEPDLSAELRVLAGRSRELGLATALSGLLRLAAWLDAITACPEHEPRGALLVAAWDETQALVAWLRLFRREIDLLVVEAELRRPLAEREPAGVEHARRQPPALDALVWPAGCVLEDGGGLRIVGVLLRGAWVGPTVPPSPPPRAVILHDQIEGVDAERALDRPVVSRLFQDSVSLGRLMRSEIRLRAHPCLLEPGRVSGWPAFRAVPDLSAQSADSAPDLPLLDHARDHEPARATIRLDWQDGDLSLEAELPVVSSPVLRLNARKLLLSGAATTVTAVVGREGHQLEVLQLRPDGEEDVSPWTLVHHPVAGVLTRERLAALIDGWAAAVEPHDAGAAFALRGALAALGALAPRALGRLRARVGKFMGHATDVGAAYRLGRIGRALGEPLPREPLLELVRAALVDPVATTAQLHEALWLALAIDRTAVLEATLRSLRGGRLAVLRAPTLEEVVTRALVDHALDRIDHPPDDEPEEAERPEGLRVEGPALAGLEPLEELVAELGPAPTQEQASLHELLALGDALWRVKSQPEGERNLAALDLDRVHLATRCADGLLYAREETTPESASRAVDALLLLRAADLTGYLLGD